MNEGSTEILVHKCQLEYINQPSLKQKPVTVELLTDSERHRVRMVSEERNAVLQEVEADKIGAAAVLKLEYRSLIGRKASRLCMVLFYKPHDADQWHQFIIVDKERPTAFNCVQQLKTKITEICFASTYPLTNIVDRSTHELQFTSSSYMAIMPSDGTQQCENSNVLDFCYSLASGYIFRKNSDEVTIQPSSDSAANSVKFVTAASKCMSYLASSIKAAEQIKQESSSCRRVKDPLPPIPVEDEEEIWNLSKGCGRVPRLDEPPFWLKDDKSKCRTSSIYGYLPAFQDELLHHENRRLEVSNREPIKRFQMFVKAVSIKPRNMKAVTGPAERESQRLYEIPQVSDDVHDILTKKDFPQDNVESTFASFLKKVVRNTLQPESAVCPIGLSQQERERFCWRLDLIEYDVIKGPGWKEFAHHVMSLDNDDLEMIDEFSCKYKCQVVEVVLDHWYKLHSMKSDKCLQPALRRTIIKVLNEMQKVALLQELHWEHEV